MRCALYVQEVVGTSYGEQVYLEIPMKETIPIVRSLMFSKFPNSICKVGTLIIHQLFLMLCSFPYRNSMDLDFIHQLSYSSMGGLI